MDLEILFLAGSNKNQGLHHFMAIAMYVLVSQCLKMDSFLASWLGVRILLVSIQRKDSTLLYSDLCKEPNPSVSLCVGRG